MTTLAEIRARAERYAAGGNPEIEWDMSQDRIWLLDHISHLESIVRLITPDEKSQRIAQLEAELTEAKLQRDSWKRIAESGLGIPQPDGDYTNSLDIDPPCDTPDTPEAMHARIVNETADAIAKDRGLTSETRRAHSKSEYKRLTALGVDCTPPETAPVVVRDGPLIPGPWNDDLWRCPKCFMIEGQPHKTWCLSLETK
jgi:hypothetical protein